MANIFISYRRRDSAPIAKRIYEWLAARPNGSAVFMDLSGIEPGENFHEALRREIDAAEVMLVIIGKEWAFAEDADGMNRLDKARDVVRREIAIGLESSARVVPVLVSARRCRKPFTSSVLGKLQLECLSGERRDLRGRYDSARGVSS